MSRRICSPIGRRHSSHRTRWGKQPRSFKATRLTAVAPLLSGVRETAEFANIEASIGCASRSNYENSRTHAALCFAVRIDICLIALFGEPFAGFGRRRAGCVAATERCADGAGGV